MRGVVVYSTSIYAADVGSAIFFAVSIFSYASGIGHATVSSEKGVSFLVSFSIKAKGKMKSQPAENEYNAEI